MAKDISKKIERLEAEIEKKKLGILSIEESLRNEKKSLSDLTLELNSLKNQEILLFMKNNNLDFRGLKNMVEKVNSENRNILGKEEINEDE